MNYTTAKSAKRQPQRPTISRELPGDTDWPRMELATPGPICVSLGVVGFVATAWAHQFVVGRCRAAAFPGGA